ncbi:MAG: hypothetical protein JWM41_347 [Gemmatimonadetes bacterium]|nr:hypothetical protein [Gemmatimonadota bacterium]
MSRLTARWTARAFSGAAGALAVSAMIACSDATGPRTIASGERAQFSGSSGSGGGGGGGGGGGVVGVPATPPACSTVSLTPNSGYTPQGFRYAAIWVNVKLKNCSTAPMDVSSAIGMELTGSTPVGSRRDLGRWIAQPGDSIMYVVDFDFQNYSTSYTSSVYVNDTLTGDLVATCSAVSMTPKPRGVSVSGGGGNGSSDTACYK